MGRGQHCSYSSHHTQHGSPQQAVLQLQVCLGKRRHCPQSGCCLLGSSCVLGPPPCGRITYSRAHLMSPFPMTLDAENSPPSRCLGDRSTKASLLGFLSLTGEESSVFAKLPSFVPGPPYFLQTQSTMRPRATAHEVRPSSQDGEGVRVQEMVTWQEKPVLGPELWCSTLSCRS